MLTALVLLWAPGLGATELERRPLAFGSDAVSASGSGPVFALTYSTGRFWHHQSAVTATVDQFLGPNRRGRDGRSSFGVRDSEGVSVAPEYLRELGLRARWSWPMPAQAAETPRDLASHQQLEAELSAGLGSARYFLENGVAPFLDPTSIKLDYATLGAELRVSAPMGSLAGGVLLGEAGGGIDRLRYRAQVTSALLDVHRTSYVTAAYAALGIRYETQADPIASHMRLRVYPGRGSVELRLGVDWAF